jgi:DNA-binding GntR family transcriptional regulator
MSTAERPPDAFGTLHLEHSSTVDRVADELRRAVFEGELESGTPLREVALAESLGVSRPTLREALALLVAEGLATREPNRGVSVASPDPDSVRDVSRARAVLETAGIQHWPTAGEEARDAVRHALDAYERAVADNAPYQELNQRHLAIHLSLVGLTESPRLVAMAEVDRVRRNARDQAGSHHHLLDLLESGDVAAAVAELGDHLGGAETAIIERLDLE